MLQINFSMKILTKEWLINVGGGEILQNKQLDDKY